VSAFTLVIANRKYSSWSLRPWLVMKRLGLDFEEIVIPLYRPDTQEKIAAHTGSGKLPVLEHDGVVVWESLAICEYLAELFPKAGLWPAEKAARALARAVSHEMHAGFQALRSNMPCNFLGSSPGKGRGPGVDDDVRRIVGIWQDCRERFGGSGPFLFGAFTVADAMYAPVVSRFRTYGVALPAAAQVYADAVWALPEMAAWLEAARAEPYTIPHYEL
jgi:glutathione S-transferase